MPVLKTGKSEIDQIKELIAELDADISEVSRSRELSHETQLDRVLDARLDGQPEPSVVELDRLQELRQRALERLRVAEQPIYREQYTKAVESLRDVENEYVAAGDRVIAAIRELLNANRALHGAWQKYLPLHSEARHLAVRGGLPPHRDALPNYPIGNKSDIAKYMLRVDLDRSPVFQYMDDAERRWRQNVKDRRAK